MKKLLVLAVLIFAALLARLIVIQLYDGKRYEKWSRQITLREQIITAARGTIVDRHGKGLAENRPVFEAYLLRHAMGTADIDAWAELLQMDRDALAQKIAAAKKSNAYQPFPIKDRLSLDQVLALREKKLQDHLHTKSAWQGLEIRTRSLRYYAEKSISGDEALSHLVGYVRGASETDLADNTALTPHDVIGAVGVERRYDTLLRGKNGRSWQWVDAWGREVSDQEYPELVPYRDPPIAGSDLILTIDSDLQEAAYQSFAGRPGALVALSLPEGELMTMVSSPGYPLNAFIGGISKERWQELTNAALEPLVNRAVQGAYPPASTYKIVTAAAALESGALAEEHVHHCPGAFTFGGHRFGCWNKGGHGSISVRKALEASCDVFFYKVGVTLDVDVLARMAARFGFGSNTGLNFPSERAGFIPTRAGLRTSYHQEWSKGQIFPVVIGQGANTVTPLQAARAIARFATNNAALEPRLLHAPIPPSPPIPLLSEKTHALIAEGLVRAVSGPSGTGHALAYLPFTVAGKTGTAETGTEKEDHAWFVGYAPAENPQLAVAVVVEHGGHGGAVAAPIVRDYLNRYMALYGKERPAP